MTRFAIFVTFKLKSGSAEAFKPHILANAEASVRDEADCHQFDVSQVEDDPDTFHFYEVYTNAAALDEHRKQPHFMAFVEAAGELIEERTIRRLHVLNAGNTGHTL